MGSFCVTNVNPLPEYDEVVTDTQLPGWVSEGGKRLFESAAELARSPYPTYQGARIASYGGSKLTPEEQQASDLLSKGATSYQPYIDMAGNMASGLGKGYDQASRANLLGPAYEGMSRDQLMGNYEGASREDLMGQSVQPFSMEQAQPYLDIYQGAQDSAVDEVRRQTELANVQNRATAARSGAFGGSRLGIQEGMTSGEGARAAGDLRAQAAAQGLQFASGRYDQDVAQSERDRAARFGAEDMMRGQFDQDRQARFGAEDVSRSQYDQDMKARFGAEDKMRGRFDQDRQARFGAEDVSRSQYDQDMKARFGAEDSRRAGYETQEAGRLRATETQQGFAPLVQGLQEQAASGLFTAGQARRNLDQQALDLAYADYVEQRQSPYDNINYALGVLQGTPYNTRNISLSQGQQFIQSPSVYGQTLGGLGALASAYYTSRQ
tara:strand:+ start:569 stop:1879 length:1311 start_codon:yes stop_codon:yes gene_type:complete